MEDLRSMVLSFRVSELQMLLGFAGRNKTGRKNELQARALELLKTKSTPIHVKIRELYKSIQQGSNMLSSQSQAKAIDMPSRQQSQPYSQSAYSSTDRFSQSRGSYPPIYNPNPYNTKPSQPLPPPPPTYPVHPDVRFKKLAFYNVVAELIKPSSLVPTGGIRFQEASFEFHLTPIQSTDIASSRDVRPASKMDYSTQVQLRFCLLETSSEQDDCFPSGVCVKVNGKMCQLPSPVPTNRPGVEAKRPPRPVNITNFIKLSPTVANHLHISWTADYNRGYSFAVYLVKKLTATDLLSSLKAKGIRNSDFTRALIKDKLREDADCEIATTSLRVSLNCPLGKCRMSMPCRASTCNHLQCFDASTYLQMNERKPTWMCPVCNKPAYFDHLVIDGYFQEVLTATSMSSDNSEIQLHQDGAWSTIAVKKEPSTHVDTNSLSTRVETVSEDEQQSQSPPPKKAAEPVVIDLTLSDSDDDDDDRPSKRIALSSDTSNSSGGPVRSASNSSSGGASSKGTANSSPHVITLDSPSPSPTPTAGSPCSYATHSPPRSSASVPASWPSTMTSMATGTSGATNQSLFHSAPVSMPNPLQPPPAHAYSMSRYMASQLLGIPSMQSYSAPNSFMNLNAENNGVCSPTYSPDSLYAPRY